MLSNCFSKRTFAVSITTVDVLNFFSSFRSIEDAFAHLGHLSPPVLGKTIRSLISGDLLLEEGSKASTDDQDKFDAWAPWMPDAAFHFLTKDAAYVGSDWTDEQKQAALPKEPAPPPFKSYLSKPKIELTKVTQDDLFSRVLKARRTHRHFSQQPVALNDIAVLLGLVWGVQGYLSSKYFGMLARKTSPSGGARHPVEVYVMALNVADLDRGIYHYNAETHQLAKISDRATPELAQSYCADQLYVSSAAALFIMTGMFARTMWKYPQARAYRVVTLDAGHLGQTFCLAATWLGLAPFVTAALRDTEIEAALDIDGFTETVLYLGGLGHAA